MPLPYVSENIIAEGFRAFVRIGNSPADAKIVGFVDSFSFSEDFQVQQAGVIGQLVPISIDAQGYSCSLQLSGFVPSKKSYDAIKNKSGQSGYSFAETLFSYLPDAREMMDNERVDKYPYLDLVEDKNAKNIICHAEGILVSNVTITAQGTGYLKANVSMRALIGKKGV